MAYMGKRDFMIRIRREKGFSQARIAAEIGVSQSYYANIENGYVTPSDEVKEAIAVYMGFPVTMFDSSGTTKEAAV